jgi:sulfur relay (sulfurtransferase) complex TusBCD TusD component (DsrE family)
MLDKAVVVITRRGMGTTGPDDEAFGVEMLEKFLHALEGREDRPAAICFVTEGVTTVADDGNAVLSLRMLEEAGVRLVSCRTCLDHYGLADRVQVGETGTMADIIDLLAAADKVIDL